MVTRQWSTHTKLSPCQTIQGAPKQQTIAYTTTQISFTFCTFYFVSSVRKQKILLYKESHLQKATYSKAIRNLVHQLQLPQNDHLIPPIQTMSRRQKPDGLIRFRQGLSISKAVVELLIICHILCESLHNTSSMVLKASNHISPHANIITYTYRMTFDLNLIGVGSEG